MIKQLFVLLPCSDSPQSYKRTAVSVVKTGSELYKENKRSFGPAEQFKITGELGHILFFFLSRINRQHKTSYKSTCD